MRASLLSILTFCSLILLPRGQAATEIPFEHRDGLIWLKVTAAGRAEPLRFLLDSGAGATVLDLRAARALGAEIGRPLTVHGVGGRGTAFRVKSTPLSLASVPLPDPGFAMDLSTVSAACGKRIDGLLGADFFRKHIVQIDFRAEKIRLLSRGELPPAGGETLPLAQRGDALCVRLSVNGQRPAWVRVDTGCDAALEWVTQDTGREKRSGPSVAATRGSRRRIPAAVQLGALTIGSVSTGLHDTAIFPGEGGLLGNGLLARFTVTFDTAKGRLFLARN